jgi:4-amino-4-deoxy-L-arabinose transferase
MAILTVLLPVAVVLIGLLAVVRTLRCLLSQRRVRRFDVVLLIGLHALILIYLGYGHGLHEWDERIHALVAKNLAEDWLRPVLYADPVLPYDYRHWNANHVWLHKQPLSLWLMAGSINLFGSTEFAVRLPSLLASCAGVWLTYRIGRLLFSERIGLAAALLHATNGFLLEAASGRVATDHVDTLFIVMVEASVFFALRHLGHRSLRSLLGVGIYCGLAVLTKWLTGLLPLVVLGIGLLHQRVPIRELIGQLALLVLIAAAIALPWQVYILQTFPHEAAFEYRYNSRHLWEALEGHAGGPLWHLDTLRKVFGESVFVVLAVVGCRLLRRPSRPLLLPAIYLLVPLVIFGFAATKMTGYVAVAYPAIFVLTAYVADQFLHSPVPWLPGKLSTVIGIVILLLPLRYGIERMKLFEPPRQATFRAGARVPCEREDESARTPVVFGDSHPIRTMFHCDGVIAYPALLAAEVLGRIDTTRYRVITNGEGLQPE